MISTLVSNRYKGQSGERQAKKNYCAKLRISGESAAWDLLTGATRNRTSAMTAEEACFIISAEFMRQEEGGSIGIQGNDRCWFSPSSAADSAGT